MDAPDPKEAPEAEREMRRELYELAETQRWVHHVADLDSGEIVTTPLDRPVTPLSRAERLSQLGHLFHPEVFDGPSQRLTPRQHYQPSGQGWAYLSALEPTLYAPAFPWGTDGTILWRLPREFQLPVIFKLDFFFYAPPLGRSVASISLSGNSFEGAQGFVSLVANPIQTPHELLVPVDGSFGQHTVDFMFVTVADPQSVTAAQPVHITMRFLPGIERIAFTGISLAAAPLIGQA